MTHNTHTFIAPHPDEMSRCAYCDCRDWGTWSEWPCVGNIRMWTPADLASLGLTAESYGDQERCEAAVCAMVDLTGGYDADRDHRYQAAEQSTLYGPVVDNPNEE